MTIDELGKVGVSRMNYDEMSRFLSSHRTGVLALPGEEVPYVLPMSFGYDGGEAVYFTYILGTDSHKEELSERADVARFLVYSVDSPFRWGSVILTGPLDSIPREEWGNAPLDDAWRPEVFQRAESSRGVAVYRLGIENWTGFRHTGLPPGFKG